MRAENASALSYDHEQIVISWLRHYDRWMFGLGRQARWHILKRFKGDTHLDQVTIPQLRGYAREEGICSYWSLGGRMRRRARRAAYDSDEWQAMNNFLRNHKDEIIPDLSTVGFVHRLGSYYGILWSRPATMEALKCALNLVLPDFPARKFEIDVPLACTAQDGGLNSEHGNDDHISQPTASEERDHESFPTPSEVAQRLRENPVPL
jgi:hypothetical protein